ncbi:hypothetical protein COHA_001319 [Chlorella ohadii]|uniref:Uncharacterized protein n=1 Tax=Chlorella ohadii TaxID=2649997 RepID=A0AAD5E228_9CHLO|nr:hypothetical protein COHA_001319 [Chlorella ohadii]
MLEGFQGTGSSEGWDGQDSPDPLLLAEMRAESQAVAEMMPVSLDQLLAEVFLTYQARSPEELAALMHRRYSPGATFIDPTVHAKSRWEAALAFFYPIQHLFSRVHVSGISAPQLELVPQRQGPPLLQVTVQSHQCYQFSRNNHISQQIFPEQSCREATTALLVDPRTGQVLRHEDYWQHHPPVRLPMAWRRLNCLCVTAVHRLLGWGRELREAEARTDQRLEQ